MKSKLLILVFALTLAFNSNGQWVAQYSGFTLPFFDASFLSADKGYVVGQFLTIVETHDGGSVWNMQMDTTTSWFIGCYFTDSSTGYAVANGGQMYKTINGGANWNLLYTGTTTPLYAVYFVNADTGFVCGLWTMLKTTNAGATWIPYTVSTSLNRLFFTNVNQGYSIGQSGVILKTTNGGGYWAPQTSGVTGNLNGIYFTDTSTGWIVGDGGAILKTTNGGTTWSPLTSGVSTGLSGVWFITSSIGYVVGSGGVILKTTDGGVTWVPQISGVSVDLNKVVFPTSSVGYAVGAAGTILKTVCGTNPTASFIDTGTRTVGFVFSGTGSIDSVLWSFGDGSTSTTTNPTHAFAANGSYTVCVYAYSTCGNDTACKSVVVSGLGAPSTIWPSEYLNIYPSPATKAITISAPNNIITVAIVNFVGQTVHSQQYNSPQVQVDVANLPAGLYFVKVNGSEVTKFIKE